MPPRRLPYRRFCTPKTPATQGCSAILCGAAAGVRSTLRLRGADTHVYGCTSAGNTRPAACCSDHQCIRRSRANAVGREWRCDIAAQRNVLRGSWNSAAPQTGSPGRTAQVRTPLAGGAHSRSLRRSLARGPRRFQCLGLARPAATARDTGLRPTSRCTARSCPTPTSQELCHRSS